MGSSKSNNKPIELVFPRAKTEMDVYLPNVKADHYFQMLSADIQCVAEEYSEYGMDSIETKIESIINSPQTTKPVFGSRGKNRGLSVLLKPSKATSANDSSNHAREQVQRDNKDERLSESNARNTT
jgi:hypothetical protein